MKSEQEEEKYLKSRFINLRNELEEKENNFDEEKKEYFNHISKMKREKQEKLEEIENMKEDFEENEEKHEENYKLVKHLDKQKLKENSNELKKILNEFF